MLILAAPTGSEAVSMLQSMDTPWGRTETKP
jgi:hypothetical protein